MSNYHGYRCLTCHANSDCWLNHGDSILRSILDHWRDVIKPMYDYAEASGWIILSVMETSGTDVPPLDWLAKHDGHQIVVRSQFDTFDWP